LCAQCKKPAVIPDVELLREGFSAEDLPALQIYSAVGCEYCTQGYKGRIGIFEVLPLTETIGAIIMQNRSAVDIAAQAQKEGMHTLRAAALAKVKSGITSLAEINRVTID
jgi:type IV pilus assembly protein PilB